MTKPPTTANRPAPGWLPHQVHTAHHVLSLGAGVQSSTLALMAAFDLLHPTPTLAIFADTHGEPAEVYAWLADLKEIIRHSPRPFRIHHVTAGSLEDHALQLVKRDNAPDYYTSDIPMFIRNTSDLVGKLPQRSCTRDFKIRPQLRFLKHYFGVKHKHPHPVITQWLGISLDELQRAKLSTVRWTQHRFPLLEMRMTRRDCETWLRNNGFPKPPRSACRYCPLKSDAEWRHLRDTAPNDWRLAVEFDEKLRETRRSTGQFNGDVFLHRSGQPLAVAPIDAAPNPDAPELWDWNSECDGVCGV